MVFDCIHHWMIPEKKGRKSRGYCKKCGIGRDFFNVIVNDPQLLSETKEGYKLQEAIDHLLFVISLSRYEPLIGGYVDERYFRKAEPYIMSEEFQRIRGNSDLGIFIDGGVPALTYGLDTTLIMDDADHKDDNNHFVVSRIRSLRPPDVRGRVKQYMPQMVELTDAFYDAQIARADTAQVIMGSTGNGSWHCLTPGTVPDADKDAIHSRIIQVAIGVEFSRRYQWTVELSLGHLSSLLVPTDPEGIREVFKFRDIPSGRERRLALRHWVQEHYRQSRTVEGAETKVREHMRGATEFDWQDLHCRIRPSQFDIERDDTSKAIREAEKLAALARRR